MTLQQEAALALREAGEWIDQHDLLKDYLWEPRLSQDGPPVKACARGALQIVLDLRGHGLHHSFEDRNHLHEVLDAAEEILANYLPQEATWHWHPQMIATWNNKPERTKEEVVKQFFKAADDASVS